MSGAQRADAARTATFADLQGRKLASGRGYNARYALIDALESRGCRPGPGRRPGRVGAQLPFEGTGDTAKHAYHFAQTAYVRANRKLLRSVLAKFEKVDACSQANPTGDVLFCNDRDYFYGFPSSDLAQPTLKVATEQYSATTTPEALQREVGADEIAAMYASRVQGRFPQIDGRALKARACMYTVTPDRDFVVDHLDGAPNVWIASACSGHGFKHSPGLGEAIAEQLRGSDRREVLGPFRRRRSPPEFH